MHQHVGSTILLQHITSPLLHLTQNMALCFYFRPNMRCFAPKQNLKRSLNIALDKEGKEMWLKA